MTGAPVAGDWHLRAIDTTTGNSGTLTGWDLMLTRRVTNTVFRTAGAPVLVDAGAVVTLPLAVPDTGVVQDLNVWAAITHTVEAGVQVDLGSPGGVWVTLSNGRAGTANGSAGRWFDDEAYELDGPTYGMYRPQHP